MASMIAASHVLSHQAAGLRSRNAGVSSRATALVVRAEKGASAKPIEKRVKSFDLSAVVKPIVFTAASNALLAMPALAASGKIFDFNLTLPYMVGQFLVLMVYLDKGWFGPVGKVLDDRDKMIRDKLAAVGDNSAEITALEEEASKILKEARAEAQATINQAKNEAQAEMTEKFDAAKKEVDAELEVAFAALEKEQAAAMTSLDAQVDKLSADILKRVLPEGTKV
ncbi:hypothetical protein BSKO_01714 [Bryopsis sp. KO-2023]|nr:hypothetical protein BSKO_01714 [Bryopsis sp. KO-2023]